MVTRTGLPLLTLGNRTTTWWPSKVPEEFAERRGRTPQTTPQPSDRHSPLEGNYDTSGIYPPPEHRSRYRSQGGRDVSEARSAGLSWRRRRRRPFGGSAAAGAPPWPASQPPRPEPARTTAPPPPQQPRRQPAPDPPPHAERNQHNTNRSRQTPSQAPRTSDPHATISAKA